MGSKVGENPAALRAAIFSLSSKNLRGRSTPPPPSRARVKSISIRSPTLPVLTFVQYIHSLTSPATTLGVLCNAYRSEVEISTFLYKERLLSPAFNARISQVHISSTSGGGTNVNIFLV